MTTSTSTRELDAALALLKDRLRRPLLAELDESCELADNLLAYLRRRPTPKLPFTPQHLPEIAGLARDRDPDEHAWEKKIADEAVAGRMYGATNAYSDRFIKAPDGFDFTTIEDPDPEAINGLNRHRWFASLARHYWDDQDPRYFDALMRHWDFYWERVPPIDEATHSRFHCIGPELRVPSPYHDLDNFIRLHNWWWAFWLSLHMREMTGERCVVLLARCLRTFDLVAARGIRVQELNVTAMQMESLYLWAASLPECVGMDVWRHAARNNLESSLNRAVSEDGVHWEQSMGYHRGCIHWYGRSYILGRLNNEPWAASYHDRLVSMGKFLDAVITPDGNLPLLSDSDRVANWRDAISLLKCVAPDAPFAHDPGPCYLSVWWTGGYTWTSAEKPPVPLDLRVFPQGGIGVARHRDPALGALLLFDNGPTEGEHPHKDNLTVHFDAYSSPVLVDPGRWIYDRSPARLWVRQPHSHNTIWIEDEPAGSGEAPGHLRLQSIRAANDPRLAPIQIDELDGIARMTTRFQGYTDDPAAMARRTVLMPLEDGDPWLVVLDRVQAPTAHIWTNSWLLPSRGAVSVEAGGYRAFLDSGLALRFAVASSEPLEFRDDEKFWCPSYGQQLPARWLRFSARCTAGWRAFAFRPGRGDSVPMLRIEVDGEKISVTVEGRTVLLPG